MVPEPALARYRLVVADLRSAAGAVSALEREINARRAALSPMRDEIHRLEPAIASPWSDTSKRAKQRVEQLRGEVAKGQAEIDRLIGEKDRLEPRRDAATRLACRCRDYLIEKHGVSHAEVDF